MATAQALSSRSALSWCVGGVAQVFPRPRTRVTVAATLPMLLFLVVFAATCFLLESYDVLMFTAPAAFWWVVLVPWVWWMHLGGYSGMGKGRSVMALLVRLSLLGLFIMLLAQPRAIRKHDVTSVVFALDVSRSVGKETPEQGLVYVTKLATEKPPHDEVGLLLFGQNAVVELPPSTSLPLDEGIAQTLQVNRNGTNIEKALSLAAAVLSEENQSRIVLISDGVQTEGTLPSLLDELKSRNIAVDVLPVGYDYANEVWIERIELPRRGHVKIGESYEAAVILSSLAAGEGELVLLENGQPIFKTQVEYEAGKKRQTFPLRLREPGYYEYTALINPGIDENGNIADGVEQNNRAISYLHIKGEGKVLLVTDPAGDARDWEMLTAALREAKRSVDVRDAYAFPDDPLSLLPYDCVIFVNVPADAFVASQFTALKDAVYNQGSGFLMVGGANSFGPGGYHRTEVEQILPVSMDVTQKKILPKGALVIVLHTCEFPQGNTWGKSITKQAMRVLGAEDEVGVLVFGFNGGEHWLFPLTPARQYNRLAMLVNNAQIGDMPDFVTTMKLGLAGLKKSDAMVKHMIIISDGDPQPPSPALLGQFVNQPVPITISTVAVFPHGNNTQAMQMIANATGGNFYFPQDPALLPSIFVKEAKTLKKSLIQNKTFVPAVPAVGLPSAVLKGISNWPALHGYVITSLKPQANTVLAVPDVEENDPVLAIWRTGVGRTAAFTSDLSTNWGKDWQQWDKYKAFVKQLVIDISRVSKAGSLRIQSHAGPGVGVILVEDYAPQASFLDVVAEVAGPRKSRQRVKLKQVGARRYEGRFELSGQGRYQIVGVGVGDGREERVFGGFVVPYSQEYLRFRSNPIVLQQIADKTGGQILDGTETAEDLFGRDRTTTKSDRPIADLFLFLMCCVVPLDVGIRRVQIDMEVIRGWLGMTRTHTPSDETFSQLLRTKRSVDKALGEARQERPLATQGPPLVTDKNQPGPAADDRSAERKKEQAKPPDVESTTQRLLAARREKRDEE